MQGECEGGEGGYARDGVRRRAQGQSMPRYWSHRFPRRMCGRRGVAAAAAVRGESVTCERRGEGEGGSQTFDSFSGCVAIFVVEDVGGSFVAAVAVGVEASWLAAAAVSR